MALPHDDQELLSRILHFYRGELLEDPAAQDALKRLNLADPALLESLSIGLARGGLLRMLPEDEAILSAAKMLGLLDAEGRDRFHRHLIIPLKSVKGHLAGYGAVDLDTLSETLTLFEPFGCLYPAAIRSAKRACVATSALDALLLAKDGEKAALAAPAHGLTRHLTQLSEYSLKEAVLAFEEAPLREACAQALAAQGIEPLCLTPDPGRTLRDLLIAGLEPEEFLKRAAAAAHPSASQIERTEEGLQFTWPDRSWRVRLLDPHRFDHLKVSIKLTKDHRWHLDTLDLGLARQRQAFIHMAKKVVRVEPAVLYQDLLAITEEVEHYQAGRLLQTKKAASALDEDAKREAEEFLGDPAMFDRLAEDFKMLGWTGDPRAACVGYLAISSRKMNRPLALAWAEGEEPLGLPSVLLPLMPEEDLVYLTRPSPKALFYQDEEALSHRLIIAETHALSSEISSCLTKLARGEELHAQVVIREAQSGRLKTTVHHVKGPCALFLTIAKDGSGAQRKLPGTPFLPLRGRQELSEAEQEAWFLRQVGRDQLNGHRLRERIIARHRAAQKLLKPCLVVNPCAEELLRKEPDPARRQRWANLAGAAAFVRQRQKEMKSERGREYAEVGPADLDLAEELLEVLQENGWTVLNAGASRVLEIIRRRVEGAPAATFTRSQLMEWAQIGLTAVRGHLEHLEAEGYVQQTEAGPTGAIRYQLAVDAGTATGTPQGCQTQEPQPQTEEDVVRAPAYLAPLAPHNGSG